jgi:hypothetical protein
LKTKKERTKSAVIKGNNMADSRNKGAAFERDLVKRLNTFFADNQFDISCKRNLDQYQTAGMCDIEIPGHAIEAKAYKSGWWYAPAWWDQVCQACGDRVPVLIYKFNNKAIRVCVPIYAISPGYERDNAQTVVMTLDQWFIFLKKCLEADNEGR